MIFLGCEIIPGFVRPNKASTKRLLENITNILNSSKKLMSHPEILIKKHKTLIEALMDVSNVLRRRGNQYSFCNDFQILENLDSKIYNKIRQYLSVYSQKTKRYKEKGELKKLKEVIRHSSSN